jgi:hypothetical protein
LNNSTDTPDKNFLGAVFLKISMILGYANVKKWSTSEIGDTILENKPTLTEHNGQSNKISNRASQNS